MDSIPLWLEFVALIVLLFCSAFFSSSETSMMSLNKHRLKYQADHGNKSAKLALALLMRPDRLLGVILLGNNFVNIMAASLATMIGIRLWGDAGAFIMTVILTIAVLVFAEVTPKTYAALNSEKVAFPASWVLTFLLKIMYPIVWLTNMFSKVVLYPLGIRNFTMNEEAVSREELKSLVKNRDKGEDEQDMVLGVLYLDDINIEDIMIERSEIVGLNLSDSDEEIRNQILNSHFQRLLVFEDSVDQVVGYLHTKDILNLVRDQRDISKEGVLSLLRKPYFIPEGTSLRKQLTQFQKHKRQTAVVVDEYGEVIGLITLEDIIEYVVGDLGLQEIAEEIVNEEEIIQKSEHSYQVLGNISVKHLNKELDWSLPTDDATTLSGLIVEELGHFPKEGTIIRIGQYEINVLSFAENRVKEALVTVHAAEDV